MSMPSITIWGLNCRMSRSLQVPGSPSSELHTRYFCPGNERGMKLHFRPVGKPAPPAQARLLDHGQHLVRGQALAAVPAQNPAQPLVAATGLVVCQRPVAAVQAGVDLGLDMAAMEAGLHPCGLELRKNLCCRGHGVPSWRACRSPSTS